MQTQHLREEEMLEGFFSLTHLFVIVFVALLLFGIPFFLVYRCARWWDKRQQLRLGRRVSFAAVALGGITAVLASVILAFPFVIYLMAKYDLSLAPEGPVTTGFSIITLACSVLGGYVAARAAKHDELLNGVLSSFLCIAYGISPVLSNWHSRLLLREIFPLLAAPAFALFGGYLRQAQKRYLVRQAH